LPQRLWAEIREASKVRHPDVDGDDPGGDLVLNVTGVDGQDRPGFTRSGPDDDRKSPTNAAASPPVKVFVARGLKPGAVYRVDVMASNAKGRSEPLTLMISIPTGVAGADADDKNGMSNIMNTMDVGQDPDRARNLLLEQQREQERGGYTSFSYVGAINYALADVHRNVLQHTLYTPIDNFLRSPEHENNLSALLCIKN